MKKVVYRVFSALCVVILLFAGLILFKSVTRKDGEVVQMFGFSMLRIATPSMTPEYPVGVVIFVKETPAAELKIGDVISFYSDDPALNGYPNTHRIVAISGEGSSLSFTTKGDAAELNDEYPVSGSKVIGRVVGKSAAFGKLLKLFTSKYALFFLIVIPMVLIIFSEMLGIKKKFTKENGDNPGDEKS